MQQQSRQVSHSRQQESTSLTFDGSWNDGHEATTHLARVARVAHLITPSATIGQIPDGHEVVVTTVAIDPETDTYPQKGGKRSLLRPALDRIASAVGISWIASSRTDQGTHPWVCEWQVIGVYKLLDGREVEIIGTAGIDLRDGAADFEEIYATAKPNSDPDSTVRARRAKIREHAESKARLRAIRSLGLRPSYSAEELKAPFVAVHLHHHGRYRDPETQRAVALLLAQASISGRRALYGAPDRTHQSRALAAPQAAPALPSSVGHDFDAIEEDHPPVSPEREPIRAQSTPRPQPARAGQFQASHPSNQDRAEAPKRGRSGAVIPGGDEKGTPIEEASDRSLEYWERRIAKGLAEGTSRYPDRDEALVAAMRGELEFRANGGAS